MSGRLGLAVLALYAGGCSILFAPGEGDAGAGDGGGEEFCSDSVQGTDLVSDGVMVRYFIDEAVAATPPVLNDATGELPLDLVYEVGIMQFVEIDGNRGLSWIDSETTAAAVAPISGSALETLGGHTAVTVELVLTLDHVRSGAHPLWIGGEGTAEDPAEHFDIRLNEPDAADPCNFHFRLGDSSAGRWLVPLGERVVIHALLDSRLPEADRARLFINGGPGAAPGGEAPIRCVNNVDPGELLPIANTDVLVLGNQRFATGKALPGVLYYAAVYDRALTDEEVADNAARLLCNDDS